MAIVINGSGTITGVSAGGLPTGSVTADTLATNSVDSAELIDGAIDSGHLASGVGGKVLQVVSTTKTDTFTSTSGISWVDITGFSVAITPSATSSKILVCWNVALATAANNNVYMRMLRGSTAISIGDTAGSRNRTTGGGVPHAAYGWAGTISGTYLDSPSTTSATTFKMQLAGQGGVTLCVNRNEQNSDINYSVGRPASTITLIEIGA
jgi:hypothetical protein